MLKEEKRRAMTSQIGQRIFTEIRIVLIGMYRLVTLGFDFMDFDVICIVVSF